MSLFTTLVDPTGLMRNLGSRLPEPESDSAETPMPRWILVVGVGVLDRKSVV